MEQERKFKAYTGKRGYIDYLIAVDKQMYKYVGKPYSEEFERKNRLELEESLDEGGYIIG